MTSVWWRENLTKYNFCFYLGVPCLFALLVNKKGGTYRQMLSELKYAAVERGKSFSPKLIITDFESGMIPVIKTEVIYHIH